MNCFSVTEIEEKKATIMLHEDFFTPDLQTRRTFAPTVALQLSVAVFAKFQCIKKIFQH